MLVVPGNTEVTFLGEEEDIVLCPFLYCVLFIDCCIIKEVCNQVSLSSILLGVFHQGPLLFCFLFFSVLCQFFFLYKLCSLDV